MYRVFRECKVRSRVRVPYPLVTLTLFQFVEDEGDIVFYKNARGLAKMRPVFNDAGASDSGIEITEKRTA